MGSCGAYNCTSRGQVQRPGSIILSASRRRTLSSSCLSRQTTFPVSNNNSPNFFNINNNTKTKGLASSSSTSNPAIAATTTTSRRRWRWAPRFSTASSSFGYDVDSSSATNVKERLAQQGDDENKNEEDYTINGSSHKQPESEAVPLDRMRSSDVKRELVMLSLPAIAGQAIEPLAQLMETAYIGRLGPVELGSAGVSITIFNVVSKLFNIPLLSVATSFVAEDISKNVAEDSASDKLIQDSGNGKLTQDMGKRKQLSSVSTGLLLAIGIGIFEAVALSLGSGPFLNLMGIPSGSSMRIPAERFLSLRALGAPAVVLSLALQGMFRGFKDTKTPVYCLGLGNLTAVFLFPVLMYYCKLGVTGAAISTVVSQYIITFLMLWHLSKRVILIPPKMEALQFGVYMKSGGFLIGRTLAVLTTMTLATSMAARQGPVAMAAHQICMQVWLAVSLLTDALAASGQALIASYSSKGDYVTVREITNFVLRVGLITGVTLAAILGLSFGSISTVFTKDPEVLEIVRTGILFVSASQPMNALAFIFDGLHYGVSDFSYAAFSMMLVGAISSAFLLYAPSILGLQGVWSGLALFMGLRMAAGYVSFVALKFVICLSIIPDCYRSPVPGGSCTRNYRVLPPQLPAERQGERTSVSVGGIGEHGKSRIKIFG